MSDSSSLLSGGHCGVWLHFSMLYAGWLKLYAISDASEANSA